MWLQQGKESEVHKLKRVTHSHYDISYFQIRTDHKIYKIIFEVPSDSPTNQYVAFRMVDSQEKVEILGYSVHSCGLYSTTLYYHYKVNKRLYVFCAPVPKCRHSTLRTMNRSNTVRLSENTVVQPLETDFDVVLQQFCHWTSEQSQVLHKKS